MGPANIALRVTLLFNQKFILTVQRCPAFRLYATSSSLLSHDTNLLWPLPIRRNKRPLPQFGQHLQSVHIKLRMDINNRRVIPEPPPLQPATVLNPMQPWRPSQAGRPIVKNPQLSRILATMTAPSPRKSSPLGSSQHQPSPRPGFPRSKPNSNLYRRALILLEKTSGARVAGERSRKSTHVPGRVKLRVDKVEA